MGPCSVRFERFQSKLAVGRSASAEQALARDINYLLLHPWFSSLADQSREPLVRPESSPLCFHMSEHAHGEESHGGVHARAAEIGQCSGRMECNRR